MWSSDVIRYSSPAVTTTFVKFTMSHYCWHCRRCFFKSLVFWLILLWMSIYRQVIYVVVYPICPMYIMQMLSSISSQCRDLQDLSHDDFAAVSYLFGLKNLTRHTSSDFDWASKQLLVVVNSQCRSVRATGLTWLEIRRHPVKRSSEFSVTGITRTYHCPLSAPQSHISFYLSIHQYWCRLAVIEDCQ